MIARQVGDGRAAAVWVALLFCSYNPEIPHFPCSNLLSLAQPLSDLRQPFERQPNSGASGANIAALGTEPDNVDALSAVVIGQHDPDDLVMVTGPFSKTIGNFVAEAGRNLLLPFFVAVCSFALPPRSTLLDVFRLIDFHDILISSGVEKLPSRTARR